MSARRVGALTAVLAVAVVAAATARSVGRSAAPSLGSEEGAGPDSARVASLLAALGKSDALVCELIGDQIGNFWSDAGRYGVGRFADAPASLNAAKDSLHGRVSQPAAMRVLVAQFDASDPCVRRVAAKLAGRSRIETSRLVELMNGQSPRVREAAASALGEDERKGARPALERLVKAQRGAESSMAAWALGEIGDPASLPVLAVALTYDDPRTRHAAASAIGDLHDLEHAPAELVRAARTGDAVLKRLAARALAEIHDPATLDVLIELISNDDARVRLSVVEALGQIGSSKAAPALMRASKDQNADVRRAAVEALGEIGKP